MGWHKGQPGGYVREYSDVLLIFLLKGLKPEKYRDRLELKGTLANLDMDRLPDEAIHRLARGEHPLAVLASLASAAPAGLLGPGSDSGQE